MIVSFEKSFLFVHVPKTGGTSMRAVLSRYAHAPDELWTNRLLKTVGISVNYYLGDYQHFRFRTHDRISQAAKIYPPEVMARLFKFAVVRNPWDWLVSYRNFVCARPKHKRYRRVSRMSFEEYIQFAIDKGIGQQSPLLVDDQGRLLVDYVARFESLQLDFQYIAGRLHIPARLPHANRGRGGDYREQYTLRTIRTVAAAYAEDIERFGYTFDNAQLSDAQRRAA